MSSFEFIDACLNSCIIESSCTAGYHVDHSQILEDKGVLGAKLGPAERRGNFEEEHC